MKSFINTLFGNRKSKNNMESISPELQQDTQLETALSNIDGANYIAPERTSGRIKKFLSEDHISNGRAEGYAMHSEEGLQFCLKELKSRFRMEANAVDELMRDSILSKNKKIIDLGSMLPNMKEKLKLNIAADEDRRTELGEQKMMSIDGEGWISEVLYAFEKGYRKGMMDYLSIRTFTTRAIL